MSAIADHTLNKYSDFKKKKEKKLKQTECVNANCKKKRKKEWLECVFCRKL